MESRSDSSRNNMNLELVLDPFSSPPLLPSPAEHKTYSCTFCRKKFYSSQALGGHQNAHKLERTLAKKSKEIGLTMTPHSASYSYGSSSITSLPSAGRRPQPPPNFRGLEMERHWGTVQNQQPATNGRMRDDDAENGFWQRDGYINIDSDDRVDEEFSQLDLSLRL